MFRLIRSKETDELYLLHKDEIAYAGACHEECSIMVNKQFSYFSNLCCLKPCQPETRSLRCDEFVRSVIESFKLETLPGRRALFYSRLNVAITNRVNNSRYIFHIGPGVFSTRAAITVALRALSKSILAVRYERFVNFVVHFLLH